VKRPLAVVALLLSAACSSGGNFVDQRSFDCAPGADISIAAGMNPTRMGPTEAFDDELTLQVEVGNNSNREVIVRSIRVEQSGREESTPYVVDSSFRQFDQVIEAGDDHLFELPMLGRGRRQTTVNRNVTERGVVLSVRVSLANGDHYRCLFQVPSPL
jgi:hypothetical protein